MGGKSFLAGALVGAGGAYFLDPQLGRGRRTRAIDMAGARFRRIEHEIGRKRRYLEGRVEGVTHVLDLDADEPRDMDDRTVVDRIRSEVDAVRRAEGKVLVDAVDGIVTLRGQVDASDAEAIERGVRGVPGVKGVRDLLHTPDRPAPNKQQARSAG
jgi:osmotically-inducible protein OsmY